MSPPRNADGPLEKGRRAKLTDATQGYVNCAHTATRVERMPGGHFHFAREVCADCGRLVRWLPKPETLLRRRANAFRLAKLAMCAALNTWERNFIRDVSGQRKLSRSKVKSLIASGRNTERRQHERDAI